MSNLCNCARFEFRQEIRGNTGFIPVGRARVGMNGQFPTRVGPMTRRFREDASRLGPATLATVPYGHRDKKASSNPIDRYVNIESGTVDQGHGCKYEAEDFPRAQAGAVPGSRPCQAGDVFDFGRAPGLSFRQRIIHTNLAIDKKTIVAEREFRLLNRRFTIA